MSETQIFHAGRQYRKRLHTHHLRIMAAREDVIQAARNSVNTGAPWDYVEAAMAALIRVEAEHP